MARWLWVSAFALETVSLHAPPPNLGAAVAPSYSLQGQTVVCHRAWHAQYPPADRDLVVLGFAFRSDRAVEPERTLVVTLRCKNDSSVLIDVLTLWGPRKLPAGELRVSERIVLTRDVNEEKVLQALSALAQAEGSQVRSSGGGTANWIHYVDSPLFHAGAPFGPALTRFWDGLMRALGGKPCGADGGPDTYATAAELRLLSTTITAKAGQYYDLWNLNQSASDATCSQPLSYEVAVRVERSP